VAAIHRSHNDVETGVPSARCRRATVPRVSTPYPRACVFTRSPTRAFLRFFFLSFLALAFFAFSFARFLRRRAAAVSDPDPESEEPPSPSKGRTRERGTWRSASPSAYAMSCHTGSQSI